MKRLLILLAAAPLLGGCVFFTKPEVPDYEDNHLKPTGHSAVSYLAKLITDNRSAYGTSAFMAIDAVTQAGTGCQPNSVEAIEKAIDGNVDFVSLQVRTTYDAVPVCYGSDDISSITGSKTVISGQFYEDLHRLAPKIPTLEEALVACRGKVYVCLDMTKGVSEAKACALLDSLAMDSEVLFYFGALGTSGQDQSDAWKKFTACTARIASVMPLFDATSTAEFDFIEGQDLSTPVVFNVPQGLVSACHSYGFGTCADISASDALVKDSNLSVVKQYQGYRYDILRTQAGDAIKSLLKINE